MLKINDGCTLYVDYLLLTKIKKLYDIKSNDNTMRIILPEMKK